MLDDEAVLGVERLLTEVKQLAADLRARYTGPKSQVTGQQLRTEVARVAEQWMVEYASIPELQRAIGSDVVADLNVQFQRLLRYSESATQRQKYDAAFRAIGRDVRNRVVVPLKQAARSGSVQPSAERPRGTFQPTVFLAHSFDSADQHLTDLVLTALERLGFDVRTGEKPRAARISDKVRDRINDSFIFVGLFTRREKLANQEAWTTSEWLIDEKALAYGFGKQLVLLKENGVKDIGGIQGDYEYIKFSRDAEGRLITDLLALFEVSVGGLA